MPTCGQALHLLPSCIQVEGKLFAKKASVLCWLQAKNACGNTRAADSIGVGTLCGVCNLTCFKDGQQSSCEMKLQAGCLQHAAWTKEGCQGVCAFRLGVQGRVQPFSPSSSPRTSPVRHEMLQAGRGNCRRGTRDRRCPRHGSGGTPQQHETHFGQSLQEGRESRGRNPACACALRF